MACSSKSPRAASSTRSTASPSRAAAWGSGRAEKHQNPDTTHGTASPDCRSVGVVWGDQWGGSPMAVPWSVWVWQTP